MDRTAAALDAREKVTSDLRNVIREAEHLLKNAVDTTDNTGQQARRRTESALRSARANVARAEASLLERTREAASRTDDYVQAHAWQSVAVGALAGLMLGMLASRR